jgi:hypothetical protein
MEKWLEDTWQTTEQLQSRARELRAEAAETDLKGVRDALLVLAARYKHAAADPIGSA